MQHGNERISKTRGIYFLRLIGRVGVFLIAILIYIFDKEKYNIADGWNFFNEFSPLHLLWIIWMWDMVLQLIPVKAHISIGSQKVFESLFRPIKEKINYTTNSFHCGVWEDITPIEKQDIEHPMFHLCNGGNIQYCRYPIDYNIEAIKTLVRRAMDMGFYEGVNLQLDYCEKCGHQFVDSDTCPKCGSEDITRIERMNGYLGYSRVNGRTMYADHKLEEFKDRVSM